MDRQAVIDATRRWIASFVIGLNLCPFARRVFESEKIRYVVTEVDDEAALCETLRVELRALAAAAMDEVETTLLIHPRALVNFLDYNDFLAVGDRLIQELGLGGVVQIASFHPAYRFEGTAAGDVENFTNRSPFPMLHLLREESVTAVAGDPGELLNIPRRNVEALRELGQAGVVARLRAITEPPP